MVDNRNEEAASPVIGIILMVAITVILAAIIGSYVFGAPQNVTKTNVVAATAEVTPTGAIYVLYQGGQDGDKLTSISITAPNGTTWYTSTADGALSLSSATLAKPNVGAVMKLYPSSPSDWPSSQKHIVVAGAFNDGTSQVILDTIL